MAAANQAGNYIGLAKALSYIAQLRFGNKYDRRHYTFEGDASAVRTCIQEHWTFLEDNFDQRMSPPPLDDELEYELAEAEVAAKIAESGETVHDAVRKERIVRALRNRLKKPRVRGRLRIQHDTSFSEIDTYSDHVVVNRLGPTFSDFGPIEKNYMLIKAGAEPIHAVSWIQEWDDKEDDGVGGAGMAQMSSFSSREHCTRLLF